MELLLFIKPKGGTTDFWRLTLQLGDAIYFFFSPCDCHPVKTWGHKWKNHTGLLDTESGGQGSWFLLWYLTWLDADNIKNGKTFLPASSFSTSLCTCLSREIVLWESERKIQVKRKTGKRTEMCISVGHLNSIKMYLFVFF